MACEEFTLSPICQSPRMTMFLLGEDPRLIVDRFFTKSPLLKVDFKSGLLQDRDFRIGVPQEYEEALRSNTAAWRYTFANTGGFRWTQQTYVR
jgi:hypothetical protein